MSKGRHRNPEVPLAELVSFRTGKLNSNAAVLDGKYPFFTCSQETLRTDTWSFDDECVLLAGNNANGIYPLKYHRGKFDAYQRTYVIRTLDPKRLNPRFLYYALQPRLTLLKSLSTGAATKFLTLTILNQLTIELPEIKQQEYVVDVLSAYDDLIENNTRRIAILEEIAQSIYREWFISFRFPGNQEANFAESDADALPPGWNAKRVGDVFKVVLGGTPARANPEYWEGGSVPWINSGKVNELRITDESEFVTEAGLRHSAAKLMPVRTTVVAITGATLGQVSLLEIEASANQSVVGITDPTGLRAEFLYVFFTNTIKQIIQHASGGAQQHINKGIIEDVQFLDPAEPLVRRFKSIVEPMFDEVANLLRCNRLLRRTRDLLLPKLISGEIELPAAEAELEAVAA
jgi:type I restriction enzyme S subunit